jgi:hypothetical protein
MLLISENLSEIENWKITMMKDFNNIIFHAKIQSDTRKYWGG